MKWLQWTLADPFKEIGGAEIFALCVAQELKKIGVEVHFSQDPQDLFGTEEFDVIQTHGSALPKWSSLKHRSRGKSLRIHTVHGSSLAYGQALGRRSSGLVKAGFRELEGCLSADIVWTCDQNPIFQHRFSRTLNKHLHYSLNAWDSARILKTYLDWKKLSAEELSELEGRWLFVGRGHDPQKNHHRFAKIAEHAPQLKFASIPGGEFASHNILSTGKLNPSSINDALNLADGFVLTSVYEACPLVVLEALATGTCVVATRIDALRGWEDKFSNFFFFRNADDPKKCIEDLEAAKTRAISKSDASKINKSRIPTWKEIAEKHLELVKKFQAQ